MRIATKSTISAITAFAWTVTTIRAGISVALVIRTGSPANGIAHGAAIVATKRVTRNAPAATHAVRLLTINDPQSLFFFVG